MVTRRQAAGLLGLLAVIALAAGIAWGEGVLSRCRKGPCGDCCGDTATGSEPGSPITLFNGQEESRQIYLSVDVGGIEPLVIASRHNSLDEGEGGEHVSLVGRNRKLEGLEVFVQPLDAGRQKVRVYYTASQGVEFELDSGVYKPEDAKYTGDTMVRQQVGQTQEYEFVLTRASGEKFYFHDADEKLDNHEGCLKKVFNVRGDEVLTLSWEWNRLMSVTEKRSGRTMSFTYLTGQTGKPLVHKIEVGDRAASATARRTVYFGYDANQNLARVVVSTPVPADRSKKVLAAWEYVYDTTSDPASANYNNLLYVVGPEGWRKLIADGKASAAALDLTGKTGYADTVSHPADVTWSDYAEEAFYYGTGDAADRVEKYVGGGCSGCGSGTGGHLYRYSAYHGASFAGKNKNGGTSAAYKYSSAYGELPTVTAWDSATCEYVEMDAFGRTVYRSTFVKDGGSMIECDMTKYVYDSRGRLEQTIHNPGVTGKEYTEVTVYDEGKDRSHTSQLVSGGTTRNLAYYEYDDSPTSKSYGKLLRVKRHARADAEADADDRETEYEYYGSGVAAAGQLKYVTYPKDYKGDGDAWTGGGTSTYLQRRTYYTYYDDWDTERNKVYYLKVKDVTEQYMTGGDWQDFTTTRYEYYDGTDLVNGFNGKVKKVTRDWTLNGQGGLNVVTQYLYDDYGDTKRIVEDAGGENLATDTSWTAADDPADTAHETGKHQLRAVTQRLGKLAGGPTGSMDANNQRVVERWRTPGGGTVQLLERARIGSSAEQSTGRTDYQLDAMGEVVRATRYFEAGDTDAVRFDELVFHDNLGRLYRQVDGDDGYTETKYNARRLVEQRAWGSHSVSGGQDVFSESGVTAKYAYHGTVPWLDSVEDGGARERTEYHYDTWGRVSYVQRRRWDEAAQDPAWQTLSTVGYAYNNFDEVVETKAWNQGVNPGNNPPTPASWSRTDYTADGRVFRQATLDAGNNDARVVAENHSYYGDGQQKAESRTIATTHGDAITTDEFNAGPRTLSAFDKLGRQASVTDAKENKADFTFDKLGRTTKQVTTEQKPDGGTKTSYLYSWHDYLGRSTTTADYGVCASDPAPSSAPADAGAACLVTRYAYSWGSDGVPGASVNREYTEITVKNRNVASEPATRSYRDWLGRTVVVWENYGGAAGDRDKRYTAYEYDDAGRVATIKAADKYENDAWHTQDTVYTFDKRGRTLTVTYPDTNAVTYTWQANRDELSTKADQNGLTITYSVRAANPPSDNTIYALHAAEEVTGGTTQTGDEKAEVYTDGLGRTLAVVTSDWNGSAWSETTRVARDYGRDATRNPFQQLRWERTMLGANGLYVGYGYDAWGRGTDLYYPDPSGTSPTSRHLVATLDVLGRVTGLKESAGSDFLVYSYLGYRVAEKKYPTPGTAGQELVLFHDTNPALDGYDGWGRITDQRVVAMNGGEPRDDADIVRIRYGYDDYSNRTFRKDELHPDGSQAYAYDKLQRLVESKQVKLDSVGAPVAYRPTLTEQDWTLSKLGNWDAFTETFRGGGTLTEDRTHGAVNELTGRALAEDHRTARSHVLLYDAFGSLSGEAWAAQGGSSWSASGGKLLCGTTGGAAILTGEKDNQNLTLGVSLDASQMAAGDQAGLVFAWQSASDYWAAVYDKSADKIKVQHWNGSAWENVTASDNTGGSTGLVLQVTPGRVVEKNTGLTVAGTFAAGQFGLYAATSAADKAAFDDFYAVDMRRSTVFLPGWECWGGTFTADATNGQLACARDDTTGQEATGTVCLEPMAVYRGVFGREMKITATLSLDGSNNSASLYFLWQDPNNYWLLRFESGVAKAYQVTGGGLPQARGSSGSYTGNQTVVITLDGTNSLSVKVGGADAFSHTATLTEGYVGFGGGDGQLLDLKIETDTGSNSYVTDLETRFASAATTLVSDKNGNQTFDGVFYFKYDYRNRPCEVYRAGTLAADDFENGLLKAGSASKKGSSLAVYTYDGANRRLRKVVTNCGSMNQDTRFYYAGWQCLEDRAITTSGGWSETLLAQYTWGGRYLDELVSFGRDTSTTPDGTLDRTCFVHQGALYSSVAVVLDDPNDETNDGQALETYQYDPYGRVTVLDKAAAPLARSALKLPFLFTGQRLDEETGQYYFKNRYYGFDTGRFPTHDLAGYTDGYNLFVAHFVPDGTDPYGFEKLSLTVASSAWSARWHWLGEDIVGAFDLSTLLEAIKEKVGKYDPKGKDCNCLSWLKLVAHGTEKEDVARGSQITTLGAEESGNSKKNSAKGLKHEADPLGNMPDPKKDPEGFKNFVELQQKRAKDPLANQMFLGSEKESGELTEATKVFFTELAKLKCDDGLEIYFYSCNTAEGERGKKMMQNVANITGGKVTGYATTVNATGITPAGAVHVEPEP